MPTATGNSIQGRRPSRINLDPVRVYKAGVRVTLILRFSLCPFVPAPKDMDVLAIFFTNSAAASVIGEVEEEVLITPPVDEEKSSSSMSYCVVA